MASFEIQLEELLRKDPAALVNAQKAAFGKLTEKTGERFVLFGAGRLGQITLAGLRKAGIEPLAFADNNPNLWDTGIKGVQVLSPQASVEQFGKNAIFVITVYTSAPVLEQMRGMGLRVASFATLAWQYPLALTPYGAVELPEKIFAQASEVRRALSLWADDISRREYLGQLLWQTSLDPSVLPPHLPQGEIYFADDLIAPLADEVFVDCGTFDGDTIWEFIKRRSGIFERIIAVEPDPANCRAFQTRLSALPSEISRKIMVRQAAVGSRRMPVRFNATGTVESSIGLGSFEVECLPLDELTWDYRPTFIKMDIEGGESDALSGARQILGRDKPTLAVCVYHRLEDLWRIPLQIRSFTEGYKFFLRRYSDECWEMVCYAVPIHRTRDHSG